MLSMEGTPLEAFARSWLPSWMLSPISELSKLSKVVLACISLNTYLMRGSVLGVWSSYRHWLVHLQIVKLYASTRTFLLVH